VQAKDLGNSAGRSRSGGQGTLAGGVPPSPGKELWSFGRKEACQSKKVEGEDLAAKAIGRRWWRRRLEPRLEGEPPTIGAPAISCSLEQETKLLV